MKLSIANWPLVLAIMLTKEVLDILSTIFIGAVPDLNCRVQTLPAVTSLVELDNSQGNSTIKSILMPTAPTIAAGVSTVAFSLHYYILKTLQLSFDATNLPNARRAQYRYSDEEPQKLDVSGRQYYRRCRLPAGSGTGVAMGCAPLSECQIIAQK